MPDVSIDADDPRGALEDAFARLAASQAVQVCVRLGERVRANHHLAHALRACIEATPSLRHVVLEHPSAAIGFVASSLSLWLPGIVVEARLPRTSTTAGPAREAEAHVVCSVSTQDGQAKIRAAFETVDVRSSRALVVVFDGAERIDRTLLDLLVAGVASGTSLQRIVLVHPSPGIGFIASGVALRCPSLRVLAAPTLADAERLLRDPG